MPALPDPAGSFEQAPVGTHVAICCAIIDLGTQPDNYKGKENAPARKFLVRWELADERAPNGERFVVMREYRWSMADTSNLKQDLEAWRGEAFTDEARAKFDIKNIIGAPCVVVVGRTSGDKAKVMNVAKLPKGVERPVGELETLYLWLTPDEFDSEAFDAVSPYWQDKIKSSPEYKFLFAPAPAKGNGAAKRVEHTDEFEDSIPF